MYKVSGYYREFFTYEEACDFCDSRNLDYSLIYNEEQADN